SARRSRVQCRGADRERDARSHGGRDGESAGRCGRGRRERRRRATAGTVIVAVKRGPMEGSPFTDSDNLCTPLTHDRTPCDAGRFGWSRFCWSHQPWTEVGLSTVIALLVGVNATWFIAVRGAQWTREVARLSEASTSPKVQLHQAFELPSLRDG